MNKFDQDQLSKMDADRAAMVARLKTLTPGTFEYRELSASLRAHDAQAATLTGVNIPAMVAEIKRRTAQKGK